MNLSLLRSISFQLTAALTIMLVSFGASTLLTFHHIEQHRNDNIVLNLANRLQVTAQQLITQALHYGENAPRDYPTYYRDVKLYYQDLNKHIERFDKITEAFMSGSFPPELTHLQHTVQVLTSRGSRHVVQQLEDTWADYRKELMEQLGTDLAGPRLEYAAIYIVENQQELVQATDAMLTETQALVHAHLNRINQINRLVLFSAIVVTMVIILWLYLGVLKPLRRSASGFQRVARGDFGYQIPASGATEIAQMTHSFNDLSQRLHAIFRLIDRLQHGSDMASTMAFIWEEFRVFLPMDWTGTLLAAADGKTLRLEASYELATHGVAERVLLTADDPLVIQALGQDQPLNITALPREPEQSNPLFDYLRGRDMQSILVLPLSAPDMDASGLLVFASRAPHAYRREHLELLRNIGHLVTHSFWKTVRLVDNTRLAAIGTFASAIAHEIRNPLTTIGMAIEYFASRELPDAGRQRAQLAASEITRMSTLLEDMLLYAKPMSLNLESLDARELVTRFIETHASLAQRHQQTFHLDPTPPQLPGISADRDRLMQVLLNLASNACDAAPPGSEIRFGISADVARNSLTLGVRNPGTPIPAAQLAQLTTAFYTTKSQGTGLGLAIVKRIVETHGGRLRIQSQAATGTVVSAELPLA